jgi:50S ribosomal subunit-associated GTPase HflX
VILVGNKRDLEDRRKDAFDELDVAKQRLAAAAGYETSAMTGEGLELLRQDLANSLDVGVSCADPPSALDGGPKVVEGDVPIGRRECRC